MLEDHVDLAAGFQHFPGAAETGRDDEAVAAAHGFGVALGVTDDRHALQDFAVFVFAVVDRPLPWRAFPDAAVELAARAGVVVGDALRGVAGEDFLGGRAVVFRAGVVAVAKSMIWSMFMGLSKWMVGWAYLGGACCGVRGQSATVRVVPGPRTAGGAVYV